MNVVPIFLRWPKKSGSNRPLTPQELREVIWGVVFLLCLLISVPIWGKVALVLKSPAAIEPIIQAANTQLVADEGAVNFTPTLTNGATDVTWTATDLPTGASISDTTGQITGTLSTTGHWATAVTATNSAGSDTIIVPIIVHGGTVSLSQASFSSTPYEATTADRVYQLSENVTVDASAFSILASKVCFDLNGFTLTYNNDTANTITNQDFDNFTGSDPDNWTVEGDSSHTSVVKASSYVYPRKLCEGANALRVTLNQGTWTAGTLSTGSPANIAATGHGLVTGDWVIIKDFSATTYGTAHESMVDGGYEVTRVDDNNFTINANVSAVSDSAGSWIKATCIESDSVSLPVNNRLYSATALIENFQETDDYACSIKIVDASSGAELEKLATSADQWWFYDHSFSSNGSKNFSPAVTCKSATVANAQVQIYLATEGASVTLDVCRPRLSQSYDNAILCYGYNSSNWVGQYNYDVTAWSTSAVNTVAIVDSAGGGAIEQGANRGYRGWAMNLRRPGTSLIIHGVDIDISHEDSQAINCDQYTLGNGTAGPCAVANVDITHTGVNNITYRFAQPSCIAVTQWAGDVTFADTTITDAPNISATLSTDDPATYAIAASDIAAYPATVLTNSYAFSGQSNSTWTRITVDSTGAGRSGRGFYIGAGPSQTVDGVTLTDSTFRCAELRHRETWSLARYTRALRFRNQEDAPTLGTLLDISISNCTFYCECTAADYLQNVQGARISVGNNSGSGMDSSSYTFTNCTFEAVNDQGSGLAEAIEIGRWDAALTDLSGSGCTFESNDCCVKLGGPDDNPNGVFGFAFSGNTFTKDATSNAPRVFSTFRFNTTVGGSTGSFTDNTFGAGTAYDDVIDTDGDSNVTIEP